MHTMVSTRRPRLAAGAMAVALALALPGASGRDAGASGLQETSARIEVVVRGAPGAMADVVTAVEALGGRVARRLPIIDGAAATVPVDRITDLERAVGVAGVTPDAPMRPTGFVANLGYDSDDTGSMSAITRIIGAQAAWDAGLTGKGIDIALIDTGVTKVEGLATSGKVVDGPDLSFDSQSAEYAHRDTFGHGTHMAGIIAGADSGTSSKVERQPCATCTSRSLLSDTTKFVGVAPEARIVNVKVGATDGATDVSQVIAAIDWVVTHAKTPGMNIRVINLSYGTDATQDYTLDPLAFAAENAWRRGIMVVAAGGNDGTDVPSLANPAFNPFVLAVGADAPNGTLDRADDTVPAFANRTTTKRNVDVIAPGVSVVGLRSPGSFIEETFAPTLVGSRFMRGSGTSQSAAVTTGAAALLMQKFPHAEPDQIKALLMQSAYSLPLSAGRVEQGKGLVDLVSALGKKLPDVKKPSWERGSGLGTLDGARGTIRVFDGDLELKGEKDIFGKHWDGSRWSMDTSGGNAWNGGDWRGSRWSGSKWLTSLLWENTTWTDTSWTGSDWAGSRWSGMAWDGSRWSGSRWSGSRWSGSRWSGSRWSDSGWSSASWGQL